MLQRWWVDDETEVVNWNDLLPLLREARGLAKYVQELGLQTKEDKLDLTSMEFTLEWNRAQKLVAATAAIEEEKGGGGMREDQLRELLMLLGHEDIDAVHFGKYAQEIMSAFKALQRRVEELEVRLQIDHCYIASPDDSLKLTKKILTPDERKTFPDKIVALECDVLFQDEKIMCLEQEIKRLKNKEAMQQLLKSGQYRAPQ